MDSLTFHAEIKKATARKTGLDKIYDIHLQTSDPNVMNLAVLDADQLVEVVVREVSND